MIGKSMTRRAAGTCSNGIAKRIIVTMGMLREMFVLGFETPMSMIHADYILLEC